MPIEYQNGNIIISGVINSGVYKTDYPLVIQNVTVNDIPNSGNSFQLYTLTISESNQVVSTPSTFVNDNNTVFPPKYTDSTEAGNYTTNQGYGFVEFRTTNNLYVSGTGINASGKGYIGGNGGGGAGRGLYPSGYAANNINGDPLNRKTKSEVITLNPTFYANDTARNAVFPGGGGNGGGGRNSGAGGCGGGVVRLLANGNLVIGPTAKIITNGKKDGGNGSTPGISESNFRSANVCRFYPPYPSCRGTMHSNNWPGSKSAQEARFKNNTLSIPNSGSAGRNKGSSSGGGAGPCCNGGRPRFELGIRPWCVLPPGSHDPDSRDGLYDMSAGDPNYNFWCNGGQSGAGGAGGGVLLRTYAYLDAQPSNFDLKGINGITNGGTLKIFHTGNTNTALFSSNQTTNPNPSQLLAQNIGGFYSEIVTLGYCLKGDTFKVQSLSSVENLTRLNNTPWNESFQIAFTEGIPNVPNLIDVKIVGYDLYRIIALDSGDYAGAETPPPLTSTNWKLVKRITPSIQTGYSINNLNNSEEIYVNPIDGQLSATNPAPTDYSQHSIGPTNIINPSIGSSAKDRYDRTWVYTITGWDLSAKREAFGYNYVDLAYNQDGTGIYTTLLNYYSNNLNLAKQTVSDILNAKVMLWYRIAPIFSINTIISNPCDGVFKHPDVSYPIMDFSLMSIRSTPYENDGGAKQLSPTIDGRIVESDTQKYDLFFDDKKATVGKNCFGYDDLYVKGTIKVDQNTFKLSSYKIDWGVDGESIDTISPPYVDYFSDDLEQFAYHTYYTPTKVGRLVLRDYKNSGANTVRVSAIFNKNAYNLTANNVFVSTASATIWERPPTPVFWLIPKDSPTTARSYSMPVGSNGKDKYAVFYNSRNTFNYAQRIVSGYMSSVKIEFYDESIARTFPITSWTINYDRNNSDIFTVTITSPLSTFIDTQHIRPDYFNNLYNITAISSVNYYDPGVYYPTLVIRASSSNTGFDLSAVNRIYIYPIPPTASFVSDVSSQATSGFVPLFITAIDTSTSLIQLTSWKWDIYDSYNRTYMSDTTTFNTSGNVLEHNWKWHTDNYEQDNITVDSSLNNLCLTVRSREYGWRGEEGRANLRFNDQPVYAQDKICKHLYLYERPQVPEIKVVSAFTYISSFSDDNPDYTELNAFTSTDYISGYSPYLNITFMEDCSPKSYPISSYRWDFGDYFFDLIRVSSIILPVNSVILSGWTYPFPTDHGVNGDENYPAWTTSATYHKVDHTYVLPGDYLVTLTTKVSTTNTTRSTNLSVHVEENPPVCNLMASLDKITWTSQFSSISGESPLTVYFTTTGTIAGSFPIGRILIDFGDETERLTIDRYLNNYDESPYGSDPRYYNGGIIEHTYIRELAADTFTYTVSLSVLADYSSTMSVCSGNQTGSVSLPRLDAGQMHLIKNRTINCENDKLLILQKTNDKSTYNIILSS